jgi:hypothetical protein
MVRGAQVHYRHGALDEWYLNGPAGLEQGFTLATAPAGAGGAFNSAAHTTLVRTASSSPWFGCATALSGNGLAALVGTCAGNHAYVYSHAVGGAFNPSVYTTLVGPCRQRLRRRGSALGQWPHCPGGRR